ncbi:uncharacterized protein TRAVEDRAFT_17014 [Trametes versicolor FP-101664 SS1]|uniref:uncharacterized protein n=1 Tax=Trametes versicolor (strain FP-101664) TaxID=717944 RepID=UPI00046236EA|nr:uncharacterized protein TRAVEDRAFT_17014 [Trametes versicolor FP-101664 SS1]EIW65234.1 hypothetical protein TRAVEDRAFT_17014 [Trametes versicolor FP-101664 SS1]
MLFFVDTLFVLAVAVASSSARNLPNLLHVRQDSNGALGSPVCTDARAISNSTITSGPNTVALTKFACAPIVRANDALLPAIDGPDPLAVTTTTRTRTVVRTSTTILTSTRTATATATRTPTTTATATETATETDTATVTAVSITTATATATETDVETDTATETATEIFTSATTLIQSVTATATETDTAVVASATTVVQSFTETDTATETDVETSATTLFESVTNTATVTATVTAAAPTPTLANVCAETSCGQPGGIINLPPSTEDCARLVDTLNTALTTPGSSPFIDVAPDQMFSATHGTCKFSFWNFSPTTLETCVLSVIRSASAAVSGCLEGAQPAAVSEGLCLANDGLWEVTVTRA